jgi:hypothetical protein
MMMTNLPEEDAACPGCGGTVFYGLKEEASSWKVFVQCEHYEDRDADCPWSRMAGHVSRATVDHADEKYEQAREKAVAAAE